MSWEEKSEKIIHQTPNYNWTQLSNEVQIFVKLPDNTKKQQIQCTIQKDYINLQLKGSNNPILKGKLFSLIKADEAYWVIEDGNTLTISLPKSKEITWTSVIQNEYEIDPITKERMDKMILLEKFQNQYEGFDFSEAQFSGSLNSDPNTFFQNITGDKP